MASTHIKLGPFALERPIGRGGMAEVWAGHHIAQGVPVAVKVITSAKARVDHFLTAFQNEVRAVAGLDDHPGIVMVFDHGEVDHDAAHASLGALVEGSPFLAMELASGGTLAHLQRTPPWPRLRRVILELLDALAHAHARGVIHRDLKPANVLISPPNDLRPGLKLSDFGLAHALDPDRRRDEDLEEIAGTPEYMAPEQFQGSWRDFGPWTDLYALGCMIFELTTGMRPFDGDNFWSIYNAHRLGPPPLIPSTPIPEAFDGWLRKLLAHQAPLRFQRAADAAWALIRLTDPTVIRARHDTLETPRLPQQPPVALDEAHHPASGTHAGPAAQEASFLTALHKDTQMPGQRRPASQRPGLPARGSGVLSTLAQLASMGDASAADASNAPLSSATPRAAEAPVPNVDTFFGLDDDEIFFGDDQDERSPKDHAQPPDAPNQSTADAHGDTHGSADTPHMNRSDLARAVTMASEQIPARLPTSPPNREPSPQSQFADGIAEQLDAMELAYKPQPDGDVDAHHKHTPRHEPLEPHHWTPPTPQQWQRARPLEASMQLRGVGQGLFGLRAIPMVGRDKERTLLWDTLRQTHEDSHTRAVVLRGAPGVGKSRLVEWICQRAHELGAATILKAPHNPDTGLLDGLARMAADHLQCHDMPRHHIAKRCRALLESQHVRDPYEWEALAELIAPSNEGEERSVRFSSAKQRHTLVRRLCLREARKRNVIVWLDDVHWGEDTLRFAQMMLNQGQQGDTPIILLLTVQDEALADRPDEALALKQLLQHQAVTTLKVAPLTQRPHTALVSQLLGLEGRLVEDVVERTGGNPLFAIQLIGDWVQRGVLDVGGRGFVLRSGEHAVIPDNIHDLWSRRLERFLADRPAASRHALELAAALGHRVTIKEWRMASEVKGLKIPPTLLADLTSARLARTSHREWHFIHNMMRESLARTAREEGRWPHHNLACAWMLKDTHRRTGAFISDRLGQHLLAGGDPHQALAPLLEGARQHMRWAQQRQAHRMLDLREEAIVTLRLPPTARAHGENMLLRAQTTLEEGLLSDAQRFIEDAIQSAQDKAWYDLLPEALRLRGHVARYRNDLQDAKSAFEDALPRFERLGDVEGMVGCLRGLGDVSRKLKDYDRARRHLTLALELAETTHKELAMASCLHGLGIVERQCHRDDQALDCYERAITLYHKQGFQNGVVQCLNSIAEVSRHQGNLAAARAGYMRALALADAVGAGGAIYPRLNLALVLLETGAFDQAEITLNEVRAHLEAQGSNDIMMGAALSLSLPVLAHRGDWATYDHYMALAAELLERTGMSNEDIARPLRQAGDLAKESDEFHRASGAYELARSQYDNLGDRHRTDELDAIIATLPASESHPGHPISGDINVP